MQQATDDELRRVETQLRAELLAMGFDVLTLADSAAARDPGRAGSTAVILIERVAGAVAVKVWVRDRRTSKPVLKTVQTDPAAAADPAILALRTAELLRANLLESSSARPGEPDEPQERPSPPRSARPAAPPAPETPAHWGVRAGASVVGGPGGIPVSLAPTLALAWYPAALFAVELTGTGPILSMVERAEGSAGIEQEILATRLRFALLGPTHLAAPYVVGGFGAHRLKVKGSASGAFFGLSNEAWTGLGLLGAGLRLQQRNVAIDIELDCMFTGARQAVVFDQATVATAGRPILAGTVGVGLQW
jgi:hypothetical protein